MHKNQKPMFNSGTKKSPQIPSVLNFFLQHGREVELFYEIGKVDHASSMEKYCIVLEDRQHSYAQS